MRDDTFRRTGLAILGESRCERSAGVHLEGLEQPAAEVDARWTTS